MVRVAKRTYRKAVAIDRFDRWSGRKGLLTFAGLVATLTTLSACEDKEDATLDGRSRVAPPTATQPFQPIGTVSAPASLAPATTCSVVELHPSLRDGRTTADIKTMQDFTREVAFSAYPWRAADGAQLKLYRAEAPGNNDRPQYWFVISGALPLLWSNDLKDLDEAQLTHGLGNLRQSPYLEMIASALRQAVDSGMIPSHSNLYFAGHSQGGHLAQLVPVLLNRDLMDPANGYFTSIPTEWATTPLTSVGASMRSNDIVLGGGVAIGARPMPFWDAANHANASRRGQQFTFVNAEADATPSLDGAGVDWAWTQSNLGPNVYLPGAPATMKSLLAALLPLSTSVSGTVDAPVLGNRSTQQQSAVWFDDLKARAPLVAHARSYIDPRNSIKPAPNAVSAPKICQDDIVFVPNNLEVFEVDYSRNDFQIVKDGGYLFSTFTSTAFSIGNENVVDKTAGLPATFSQNGSNLLVRLTGPVATGSYARLRYTMLSQPTSGAVVTAGQSTCSLGVVFVEPTSPMASELTFLPGFGWNRVTAAFNGVIRSRDSARGYSPACPTCGLSRTDVLYPADIPFVAYAPGFEAPWARALSANDYPTVKLTLVDMYGIDCFGHIGLNTLHQKLDVGSVAPAAPQIADICLPTVGQDAVKADSNLVFVRDAVAKDSVIAKKNLVADGIPDQLWVDSTTWGLPSGIAASKSLDPSWKQHEDAIAAWTKAGADDSDATVDSLFIARNRSLVSCRENLCPDGQTPSLRRPDIDTCVAPGKPAYRTGKGRVVTMGLLDAVDSDDDWLLNVWVSEGPSNVNPTVRFEYPTMAPRTRAAADDRYTLQLVEAGIDPKPGVGIVRCDSARKPRATFVVGEVGKYTVSYLVRNSRGGRHVGTATVYVGEWKGIWYSHTIQGHRDAFGGDCRSTAPGAGVAIYDEMDGITPLLLGSGLTPYAVVPGASDRRGPQCGATSNVYTPGSIGGLPGGPESLSISVDGGIGTKQVSKTFGRLFCTGFDDGTPGNSWQQCSDAANNAVTAATRAQQAGAVYRCIQDACDALN